MMSTVLHQAKQDPWWFRLICLLSGALLLFGAYVWVSVGTPHISEAPLIFYPVLIIMLLAALNMLLFYGGMREIITHDRLEVRMGFPGILVLRIKLADITEVVVHEFSPMGDFGGWGIRFNREMKAYCLSGHRGVKLRATNGKQYLVGADDPEALATALKQTLG